MSIQFLCVLVPHPKFDKNVGKSQNRDLKVTGKTKQFFPDQTDSIVLQKCYNPCRLLIWPPLKPRTVTTLLISLHHATSSNSSQQIWSHRFLPAAWELFIMWLRVTYVTIQRELRIPNQLRANKGYSLLKSNLSPVTTLPISPPSLMCSTFSGRPISGGAVPAADSDKWQPYWGRQL